MNITEIFRSIQGESTLAGLPTLFIRCAGCNLDCAWCDTQYARSGGTTFDSNTIFAEAVSSGMSAVCITGGEPLIQPETTDLARKLCDRGFTVSIETNGSLPVTSLPSAVKAVIDVKCPGSGEEGSFHIDNIDTGRNGDEYKFVLSGREDFEYACTFSEQYRLAGSHTILYSPIPSLLEPALLADWIVSEFPDARLNLQLHRFIWPHDTRRR